VAAVAAGSEADVMSYNGQMDDSDKNNAQKWWACANGAVMIVVVTSSFGTGIDLPNVRAVIVLGHAAARLLDYAQMAEHAGRNGLAAICASLWLEVDVCPDKGSKRARIQLTIEGFGDARAWARDTKIVGQKQCKLLLTGGTRQLKRFEKHSHRQRVMYAHKWSPAGKGLKVRDNV
jgi:Helicase conserved C-terminal domain